MTRRVLAAALPAALLLAGCGGRSVEAYCDTFYGDGAEFRQKYIDAGNEMDATGDPFGGLGLALSAPQELATFFDKLADVAPDEIRSDVEVIRDAFQKQSDSMGDAVTNPFGAMASGLMSSISASGSFERVDSYTTDNCGPPPAD